MTIGKGDSLPVDNARKLAATHIVAEQQGTDMKRQTIATAQEQEAARKALADDVTCSEADEQYMDRYDAALSHLTGRSPCAVDSHGDGELGQDFCGARALVVG